MSGAPRDPESGGADPAAGDAHAFDEVRGRDEGAVWETLVSWRSEGRRFALLTVIGTRGFTPRKTGTHMLAAADGTTWGTIGGGAIEQEALAAARGLLEGGGRSCVVSRHLTQELGMCCGGEMEIHAEVIEPAPVLWVIGAGNIGHALAPLAAGCGFRVRIVDGRPELAAPSRFPRATVHCREPEEFLREGGPEPADYAVVVTHDHDLDQRVVEQLLRRPLAFVGMIGSLPKRTKFSQRLRARGFTEEQVARLRTPLGVAIGAATPEEIAVSVMAELVAARRGAPLGPPWEPPARHGQETGVARPAETREVVTGNPSAGEGTRR